MPLPMFAFTGCQIIGSVTGSPAEMKEMMDLVTSGKVTPVPIIKRKLDEADATLQELRKGLIMGRAVLVSVTQASRALAYAFETGALAPERAFFLRAEPLPFKDIDAEQSFRPEYLRLKQTAWSVAPRIESGAYELGLVLLTKHKEENFANIARGWALLGRRRHAGLRRRQRRRRGEPREARRQGVRPRRLPVEVPLPRLLADNAARGDRPTTGATSPRCSRWATARG